MKSNDTQVLFSLIGALSIMALLSACGAKSSSQDFAQIVDNRLEREWVQVGCTNSGDLATFGVSRKVSLVLLEDKSLSRVETYYSASNCTDPAIAVTYSGNYIKDADTGQDGTFDLNYNRVVVKPMNNTGLGALRRLSWCGQTEWYVGVDADVTGVERNASCSHAGTPLTIRNRYRVEHEFLYLGSNDLTPSSTRPASVDRTNPFHCPCGD